MLKSRTVSNKEKSPIPGIKSPYDMWFSEFKDRVIDYLAINNDRLWEETLMEYKERLGYAKFIIPSYINFSEVESLCQTAWSDLEHHILHKFFNEVIDGKRIMVENATTIGDLLFMARATYSCEGPFKTLEDKVRLIFKLNSTFRYGVENFVVKEFDQSFMRFPEELWMHAFEYQEQYELFAFLDNQGKKFKQHNKRFRFFWAIHESFNKAVQKEPWDSFGDSIIESIKGWLLAKSLENRIKLKVNVKERELVDFFERCMSFIIKGRRVPFLQITNVANFVKSNFLCSDSTHGTTFFDYELEVPIASDVILFFRALSKVNFFSVESLPGEPPFEKQKKIELQLWTQFVFLKHKGFRKDNVEIYFLAKEHRGRRLGNYDGFDELLSKSKVLKKSCYGKIKSVPRKTYLTPSKPNETNYDWGHHSYFNHQK